MRSNNALVSERGVHHACNSAKRCCYAKNAIAIAFSPVGVGERNIAPHAVMRCIRCSDPRSTLRSRLQSLTVLNPLSWCSSVGRLQNISPAGCSRRREQPVAILDRPQNGTGSGACREGVNFTPRRSVGAPMTEAVQFCFRAMCSARNALGLLSQYYS